MQPPKTMKALKATGLNVKEHQVLALLNLSQKAARFTR